MKSSSNKLNINTIVIAIIALVTIISIGTIAYVTVSYINNKEDKNVANEKSDGSGKEDTTNSIEDKEKESLNPTNDNTKENGTSKSDNSNNSKDNGNTNTALEKPTEAELVTYLQAQDDSITSKTLGDKAKEIFITTVDFIFYGGKIKGYTFSELTDKTKLQILKIALSIDNKIESYLPGYKETLSNTYSKIKARVIELYLDLTVKVCNTIGSDTCNQAKLDFQNMKDSFSITWQFLKDIGSSAITKLAGWYEIYSGK